MTGEIAPRTNGAAQRIAAIAGRSPWYVKIAVKILLSRLGGYGVWRRLGAFKHGPMFEPEYVLSTFRAHLRRLGVDRLDGRTLLELGPGESFGTAFVARALGAERVYLVDVGAFATRDVGLYQQLAYVLRQAGVDREIPESMDDVLDGVEYLTCGLDSLRTLETSSVDVVVSTAVIEHIRRADARETLLELRRITREGGIHSHVIDLRDHLDDSLHSLRFPMWLWESRFFASSGFYTNRLRMGELLALMSATGFAPTVATTSRWSGVPLERTKLRPQWQCLDESELDVATLSVVLTCAKSG